MVKFLQEICNSRDELLTVQEKCDKINQAITSLMNKTAEKEKLLIDVRLKASKQQLFDLFNKKKKEELKPQVLSRDMNFVRLENFMIAIKEAMSLTDITELALQSSYFQKLFEELIVQNLPIMVILVLFPMFLTDQH